MCETVRRDVAAGLFLEPVIPDGICSAQRLLDIALLENLARPFGPVCPYACITVSLQLEHDGKFIGLRLVYRALSLLHLSGGTEQVLDMVPYLVGDHIGLCKISGRSVLSPQIIEKTQIQVDFLVTGTIEGPHRRLRKTAG